VKSVSDNHASHHYAVFSSVLLRQDILVEAAFLRAVTYSEPDRFVCDVNTASEILKVTREWFYILVLWSLQYISFLLDIWPKGEACVWVTDTAALCCCGNLENVLISRMWGWRSWKWTGIIFICSNKCTFFIITPILVSIIKTFKTLKNPYMFRSQLIIFRESPGPC
jgi:hypothetical protein